MSQKNNNESQEITIVTNNVNSNRYAPVFPNPVEVEYPWFYLTFLFLLMPALLVTSFLDVVTFIASMSPVQGLEIGYFLVWEATMKLFSLQKYYSVCIFVLYINTSNESADLNP